MIHLEERLISQSGQWDRKLMALERHVRVALPGIVQSFDAAKQTVTVRLAVREVMLTTQETPYLPDSLTHVEMPLLEEVPIFLPRAGGFTLTMPIAAGDECEIVFSDMDFQAWWQSGGVQNQIANRRHDLSDAIAHFGPWSQPRVLGNYSTASAQLRSDDGTVAVDVAANAVTVTAPTVTVNASQNATVNAQQTVTVEGRTVNVNGQSQVNVSGNGQTIIEGVNFREHVHTGGTIMPGSLTGPVVTA
ncbi:MAG: Gp138 family membrane-puncturing spike protein [Acidobacteriaceae bacterium]